MDEAKPEKYLAELLSRVARLEQRFSRLGLEVYAIQHLIQQEHIPYAWLHTTGEWSLDAGFLVHLTETLHNIKQPYVVEFGAGYGSKLLAKLCANRGGRLLSIEHDPLWQQLVTAELQEYGLQEHAEVRLCPLKQMYLNGVPTLFYDISWLDRESLFDVVIIDGPPASTGPLARLCGYPIVSQNLQKHCKIYLDDFDRRDEREIVSHWKSWVPQLQLRILRFQKEVCEIWLP